MLTDLGVYLVGSLIICERLRASSLECRMNGVLSMSQFRSRALKIDGGQAVHIWCPEHAGGIGGSIASGNGEKLVSRKVDF